MLHCYNLENIETFQQTGITTLSKAICGLAPQAPHILAEYLLFVVRCRLPPQCHLPTPGR